MKGIFKKLENAMAAAAFAEAGEEETARKILSEHTPRKTRRVEAKRQFRHLIMKALRAE